MLQVVNLLGKMGGRNRRFLRSPAELEYKENPEHGLRLILTFHPATSFLVPLDRSIALCRAAVSGASGCLSLLKARVAFAARVVERLGCSCPQMHVVMPFCCSHWSICCSRSAPF